MRTRVNQNNRVPVQAFNSPALTQVTQQKVSCY